MSKVCGVGINDMKGKWFTRGVIRASNSQEEYEARIYQLWSSMINRCYNTKKLSRNPSYQGCVVSVRWRKLSSFIKDVQSLPNFNLWLLNPGKYELDKEFFFPLRIYHPKYTGFSLKQDNIKEMLHRCGNPMRSTQGVLKKSKKVRGVNISNSKDIVEFESAMEAQKAGLGFSSSAISACCYGKRKTHKGYTWEFC